MSVFNAFSVDIEEWYQTALFYRSIYNNNQLTDLPENVKEILSLLNAHDTKATFFVVGSLAEKYPGLIKEIAKQGHEIASHGHSHKFVYKMTKPEFINDTTLSIDRLKKIANSKIVGYRAPTWSITKKMHWAISILKSLGLRYDSSIYPVSLNLFDRARKDKFPYKIREDFIEFPPSTFNFLGYNFPFSGGTFLRFFNYDFIKKRIFELNSKGYPAMIYFHSWEIGNAVPKLNIPKWKNLIQYGNLKSMKPKLKLLLENFKFTTIKEILQIK